MTEIWKDIKGYEGLYQVSNLGRVKSLPKLCIRGNKVCNLKEHILSFGLKRNYYFVILSKDSVKKQYLVHRLVAETFITNLNNKPCVDHINTITTDNNVNNLRWCTTKENMNNPLTIEHCKEKLYGHIVTGETRKKIKKSLTGKHPTNETRNKLSLANSGKNNPSAKAVIQYTLDMEYVNRFDTIKDAIECGFNAHISDVCLGKRKTCCGYIWRYENY